MRNESVTVNTIFIVSLKMQKVYEFGDKIMTKIISVEKLGFRVVRQ